MGNRLVTLCPTDFYDDGVFDETYEVEDAPIGTGKFSTVHLCWRRANPEQKYALKNLSMGSGDVAGITRVKEEVEILRVLGNHPGIITLIDADEASPVAIRIVMDLCEGGELYDAIQVRGNYTEPEAKAAIRCLLEAVAYIHSKGIMHRDLKPENILLVNKERPSEVKISDFGLAKMSRDYPRRLPRSHSICGSDFYLAPEVIKQEEYGREIDIWAVGVITYVLLSGSLPFFHQVLHKLYRQIVERDVSFPEEGWRNVSKGALDFILRLLQVRAADRLTADQSLGHPWLRGQTSGSSFQELANFARSHSSSAVPNLTPPSASSSTTDLQRILSKSASNAHPLEHARKVDTPGGAAAASPATVAMPPMSGSMLGRTAANPYATAGGLQPLMRPGGMPGAMVSKPPPNFIGMPAQSRTAQPMRFR